MERTENFRLVNGMAQNIGVLNLVLLRAIKRQYGEISYRNAVAFNEAWQRGEVDKKDSCFTPLPGQNPINIKR